MTGLTPQETVKAVPDALGGAGSKMTEGSNQTAFQYKNGWMLIFSATQSWPGGVSTSFLIPFLPNKFGILTWTEGAARANGDANFKTFSKLGETGFTVRDFAFGSVSKVGCWVAYGRWK